ncbi:hypothetical protein [Nonomuraea sediminis]|uniref:hypothetical protein n=1 Tax=Nonomuraea sediminis TaxID=2835864 RepID=UPI001BDBF0E9|nr:hypothetical protein [Nonomuraea sediminis]
MDEVALIAQAVPDAPPPASEVVARARARLAAHEHPVRQARMRRGWGWTAGAAVATAAVVVAVVMLVSNLAGAPEPAPPAVPPAYEQAPRVYKGLDRLAGEGMPRSATKVTIRFRPTSVKIALVVFCQQPGSIFYSREAGSGAGGTCGPAGGLSMLADKAHEPGWLGRDHQVTFWVFPPDAPVARGRGSCRGCRDLSDPRAPDRLAAELGRRPGAWSVAAYDVPARR